MSKNKDKVKKDKSSQAEGAGPLALQPAWVELLSAGNYRSARAEARKKLADTAATDADKAAAGDLLSRTGIEKGALFAGLTALAVLAAIVLVLAMHSAS